jgi:hypothetical protein
MKPASAVEPTTSVKSSAKSTPAVKSSTASAMESTATTMAAALGECRRGSAKKHERENCKENYG